MVLLILAGAIGLFCLGTVTGHKICSEMYKYRIITIMDEYVPSKNRTTLQQANDDVMQLKNEIAEKGAVVRQYLEDGRVRITLKAVK